MLLFTNSYRVPCTNCNEIEVFDVSNPEEMVAGIIYKCKNFLCIDNIQIYSRFKRKYDGHHIGTNLFLHLLTLLEKQDIRFDYIKGELTYTDARVNWIKSIPFYLHIPRYVKKLPYCLLTEIHDSETDEIVFSSSDEVDEIKLSAYAKYCEENHKDAYFIMRKI